MEHINNPSILGDVGPYDFLPDGTRAGLPKTSPGSVAGIALINQYHKIRRNPLDSTIIGDEKFQNILDWYLPYYKSCPICPAGTPHAGYFGHSNPNEASNTNYGGGANDEHYPKALVFNWRAVPLFAASTPEAMAPILDMNCVYGRKCHLQHCCRGTNTDWCNNALKPEPIGGSGGSLSFDATSDEWTWEGSCECFTGFLEQTTKTPIYEPRKTIYNINVTPRNPLPSANQLSTETCCEATFNLVQNGCGGCNAKPGTTIPTPPTGFNLTPNPPLSMGIVKNLNEPDHL